MSRTVMYLMSNAAYMPYLVISLWTLRRHWGGRVVVYSYEDCIREVEDVAKYQKLDIEVRKCEPIHRGKNSQFTQKIQLAQELDTDVGCYLDADTMINSSLDPIFEMMESTTFVATQFNTWETTGQIIKNRIMKLREFSEIPQDLVEELMIEAYPSVNGGVFAFRPESPVLEKWKDWTLIASDWPQLRRGVSIFIADEVVLHLMQLEFGEQEFRILEGGAANCSPKYQPKRLLDKDVIVWHGHGNCFARPDKSRRGPEMWLKVYEECLRENIGGIADWPEPHCGNRHLKGLFATHCPVG